MQNLRLQEKLLREQQAEVKRKQEEESKRKQEEEAKRKEIEMKKQLQLEKEKEEAEKRHLEQAKQKEEQEQANEKQAEQEMPKDDGEMKTEVQLAQVPDVQELTPHLENVGNVQQRLFIDKQMEVEDNKKSSVGESETAGDAPTESIKVELNNSIRMRRLSRSITIDTDTDLEEHGEIEPYKSPKASNEISNTNQIAVVDSVRTTRGGETDRELESGDTFDENSMMPMRSWNQSNINQSLLPGNGNQHRKWEPIATPTGKNLYWYNWQSGESQWEKPAELENQPTTNALPLPSTPKTKDYKQAHDLWGILLKRSNVVAVKGEWQQMKDSQTGEHFYHNPTQMISQWELPKILVNRQIKRRQSKRDSSRLNGQAKSI